MQSHRKVVQSEVRLQVYRFLHSCSSSLVMNRAVLLSREVYQLALLT